MRGRFDTKPTGLHGPTPTARFAQVLSDLKSSNFKFEIPGTLPLPPLIRFDQPLPALIGLDCPDPNWICLNSPRSKLPTVKVGLLDIGYSLGLGHWSFPNFRTPHSAFRTRHTFPRGVLSRYTRYTVALQPHPTAPGRYITRYNPLHGS
jgi:hypothetical protein